MKYTIEDIIDTIRAIFSWVDKNNDEGGGLEDWEKEVRDQAINKLRVAEELIKSLRNIRNDWNWATTPTVIEGFLDRWDRS